MPFCVGKRKQDVYSYESMNSIGVFKFKKPLLLRSVKWIILNRYGYEQKLYDT